MKTLIFATMLAACLAAVPGAWAQDCSNWTLWDARGTYAMTGNGWMDLSTLNPALPKGYAPVALLGAFTDNGRGGGGGWGSLNAGGMQLSFEFVNVEWGAPKADCSRSGSYSIKVKELGITLGPIAYVAVIAGDMSALEVFAMPLGAAPGAPVESFRGKRISLQVK